VGVDDQTGLVEVQVEDLRVESWKDPMNQRTTTWSNEIDEAGIGTEENEESSTPMVPVIYW
jgi:hypothetical protein